MNTHARTWKPKINRAGEKGLNIVLQIRRERELEDFISGLPLEYKILLWIWVLQPRKEIPQNYSGCISSKYADRKE